MRKGRGLLGNSAGFLEGTEGRLKLLDVNFKCIWSARLGVFLQLHSATQVKVANRLRIRAWRVVIWVQF